MDGSIVGKIITVQYFEETKNDKGGISLRFPTVKHIYDGERSM
jgi:DNA ligase-1